VYIWDNQPDKSSTNALSLWSSYSKCELLVRTQKMVIYLAIFLFMKIKQWKN